MLERLCSYKYLSENEIIQERTHWGKMIVNQNFMKIQLY